MQGWRSENAKRKGEVWGGNSVFVELKYVIMSYTLLMENLFPCWRVFLSPNPFQTIKSTVYILMLPHFFIFSPFQRNKIHEDKKNAREENEKLKEK